MTSTALLLLSSVALAWSIVGTALEPTFAHGANSVMTSILKKHEIINNYQNMRTRRTKDSYRHFSSVNYDKVVVNDDTNSIKNDVTKYDKLYTAKDSVNRQVYNLDQHTAHREPRSWEKLSNNKREVSSRTKSSMREFSLKKSKPNAVVRRSKREEEDRCEKFRFSRDKKQLSHPGNRSGVYYRSVDCTTTIEGQDGKVIQLTFVDMFHIEDQPDCTYDYLEIRDGKHGYARSLGKFCGAAFPSQISSTGPFIWMKFFSDDTIEYEGFNINVEFIENSASHPIPAECYIEMKAMMVGVLNTNDTQFTNCMAKTKDLNQPLDVLWNITAPGDSNNSNKYRIYLNFTTYQLEKTNECEENVVQVFGAVLEYPKKLAHYCGSMANPVTTREDAEGNDKGNVMYVRLYASKSAMNFHFNATFTVIRTLNPNNNEEKCDEVTEFDCEDNTCIPTILKCNNYANCRLKADEDLDNCRRVAESVLAQPHILAILVIFSLILSGMSFVFLFKCMRKLYQDHHIIKEHIRQSCEDRLDSLVSSRLTLDAKRLQRDSEPRASLERENHTNEMFKRQRNISQNMPSSIDSDYVQETHVDLEDEPWRRDIESVPVETEEVRIERNGKQRRSGSKREPNRKESRVIKEVSEDDNRSRKEIRDVSVGAPDTKESGCQTRESLFQDVSSPEGTESGSGSRGFSTFGYSGATIVRPSPPAPAKTSQMTVELLRTIPSRQESQAKKLPERRPMSTETTRSAPDVIIVSKPIR